MPVALLAQQPVRCLTDEYMKKVFAENPSYLDSMESGFQKFHTLRKKLTHRNNNDTIVIPVHFIIVHKPGESIGQGDNLSNARILSQLEVMNKDFARRNSDTVRTPAIFPVGDTGIRFCLAARDPDGQPTTGISRFATNLNFRSNELNIKNQTRWPREDYLNIWVANMGDTLGFAYIPTTSVLPNEILDGLIVTHSAFGGPGIAPAGRFGLGRTATHEAGHYLGLRHIWRVPGCGLDDGIDDTPLQDDANYFCPTHPSPTCGNNGDMFMNYMDYTDDSCMNAFTLGQGAYMRQILNTSRFSIKFSAANVCETYIPLKLNAIQVVHPRCHNEQNGELIVQASGGRSPFTYRIGANQNSTGIFIGLSAGNYQVIVSDALDITDTIQIQLINPPLLNINISSQTNNSCFGQQMGRIIVAGTGGSGTYQYSLNGNNNTTGVFENLANGTYLAVVSDGNLCTRSIDATISSPSDISITIESVKGTTCGDINDGELRVRATGGAGSFSYSLSSYGSNQIGQFTGLFRGQYSLTVRDQNQCEKQINIEISGPPPIQITTVSTISPSCFNTTDGSIQLSVTGGAAPLKYSINGSSFITNPLFSNLQPDIYHILIADANGCIKDTLVQLVGPADIQFNYEIISGVQCHGQNTGVINLIPSGGIGPYQLRINGVVQTSTLVQGITSGMLMYEIIDQNACILRGSLFLEDNSPLRLNLNTSISPRCHDSSDGEIRVGVSGNVSNVTYNLNGDDRGSQSVFSNLHGGLYRIVARDDQQCPTVLDVQLSAPAAIGFEQEVKHVKCFGDQDGILSLEAKGGTAPYSWQIGDNPPLSGDKIRIPALTSGVYLIELQDRNACIYRQTVEILQPEKLQGGATVLSHDDCQSQEHIGLVSLFAFGGTAPFSFSYDGNFSGFGLFEKLSAGYYTFMIRDDNACEILIPVLINQTNGFQLSDILIQHISCKGLNDGKVDVTISGGSGQYNITDFRQGAFPDPFSDYGVGWNRLSIQDRTTQCKQEMNFYISEPDELIIDYFFGEDETNQGSFFIKVIATGGVPPYQIALDGQPYQSSDIFVNILPGHHLISVQDANGCTTEKDFLITGTSQFKPIDVSFRLYPNPANSEIFIESEVDIDFKYIQVLDITGKDTGLKISVDFSSSKIFSLDISTLASGMYYIFAESDGRKIAKRFVKL